MNTVQTLLTDQIGIWTAADTEKKAGRGRASSNAGSVYGIRKLRELILDLAVRGKLVPQDQNDEPAGELLKRIQVEKAKLMADGKIKKDKPLPQITDEEKPFTLPLGWEWVRFSDYATDIATGPFGTMIHQSDYVEGGVPLINPSHMIDDKIVADMAISVSLGMAKTLDSYVINEGDIVMARRGEVGRIALVTKNEHGWLCGTGSFVLRFLKEICRDYLRIVFRCEYARVYLAGEAVGTTMVNLNHGILKKMPMGLPPIAEQLRIVAKVDELMALCDQLETQHNNAAEAHEKLVSHLLGTLTQSQSAADFSANWQRIAAHFDTLFTTEASIDALKQTLLQLAVMGRLVPQDPNDEPASELLKRIRAEKVKLIADGKIKKDKEFSPIIIEEIPFDLPQEWAWVRLGEALDIVGGVTLGKKNIGADCVELPYLRVANVQRGHLNLDSIKTVEIKKSELLKYRLENDDLLVTEGGDWDKVGRTAIWKNEIEPCLHQNHIFRMRKITQGLLSLWVEMYMNSAAKAYFQAASKQTTNLASINMTQLRNCLLAVPALHEQSRIVTKVDEMMALCDQLKFRINQTSQLQQKLADVVVEKTILE